MPNNREDKQRERQSATNATKAPNKRMRQFSKTVTRTKPGEVNKTAVFAFVIIIVAAVLVISIFLFILMRDNSEAVYMNGERLGVIAKTGREPEASAEYLRNLSLARLANEKGAVRVIADDIITVKSTRAGRNDIVTIEFMVSLLSAELRISDSFRIEATAIYVDGVNEAIVVNYNEAVNVLRRIFKRITETEPDEAFNRFMFEQNVEFRQQVVVYETVVSGDIAYMTLMRERIDIVRYTVQHGDTMGRIADIHGVTLEALIDQNPQHRANPHAIRAGNILEIAVSRYLLTLRQETQ